MDTEIVAAAILSAGFVVADRAPLHSGRLDDNIREKFIQYLAFIREQTAGAGRKKKKKKN